MPAEAKGKRPRRNYLFEQARAAGRQARSRHREDEGGGVCGPRSRPRKVPFELRQQQESRG